MNLYTDEYFMKQALKEAEKALEADEIPIGAVVVCNDKIIARAHNQTEMLNDVTAHAEMLAITAAANAHRQVRIVRQLPHAADHPVSIYHPEGEYLKGLLLQVE